MRKLDADLGKIYHKDNFYYLEKIFSSLGELIDQEKEIKTRAKRHGFKVVKTNWAIEDNPYYYIETVLNEYDTDDLDPLRYVYKVKLKYMK
jgi:hypothetical protein